MKIKYFSDTDTVLMEFSDAEVVETREINESSISKGFCGTDNIGEW